MKITTSHLYTLIHIFLIVAFIILYSNPRYFSTLTDTILGKISFIIVLILVSLNNIIYGIIIIIFYLVMYERTKAFEGFGIQSSVISNKKNTKKKKAMEGFDIFGIEDNLKKGKQSNSIISVSKKGNTNNVSPNESKFTENFFVL